MLIIDTNIVAGVKLLKSSRWEMNEERRKTVMSFQSKIQVHCQLKYLHVHCLETLIYLYCSFPYYIEYSKFSSLFPSNCWYILCNRSLSTISSQIEEKLKGLRKARDEEDLMNRIRECAPDIANVTQLATLRQNVSIEGCARLS